MSEKASLKDWIGGQEEAADLFLPERSQALARALDQPDDALVEGAPLPPLRHWLHFWQPQPRAKLGRDGHPALGGFLPDVSKFWGGSQTRRMWAGSQLEFHRPLMLGMPTRRLSTIETVEEKMGRSGRLVFVTVRHDIFDADTVGVIERHDIVYREESPKSDSRGGVLPEPDTASGDYQWLARFTADPVLLFRYSALTYNGHRIHYDRDYARDVEGYRGLVVHGPLLATLLVDFALSLRPGQVLQRFRFRGRRPVIDGQPFQLRANAAHDGSLKLWIADADDALAMTAEAEFV